MKVFPLVLWLIVFAAAALLILPPRTAAQASITVNAAVTYQTWRGFSMGETAQQLIYSGTAGAGCTNPIAITSAQRDQIYQYRVQDLGEVGERLNIYHNDQATGTGWLEWTRNDDSNPFNIVQSAFDSNFNIPPRIIATNGCNYYLTDELKDVQTWRNDVIADGETPWVEMTFFFYRDLSAQPTWWQTGSPNSAGCGVDEASEAFHATLNYIHANYGFYPDWLTWNEPNPNTGYFNAESISYSAPGCAKPADWYGGWVKSLHDRLANAGIPAKITGPTPAGLTETLGDLNAIALVPGAESDLGACTFHLYGTWTNADLDNISNRCRGTDGIETREDESGGDGSATALSNGTDFLSGRAGNFYAALTHGNISSYLLYNDATANLCASSCSTSDNSAGGIVITSTGSQIVLLPKFWALRQFGRYVRPGYIRVSAVSSDVNVVTTAWKRSDGSQVVVIVNNNSATNQVTVNGLPNLTFNIHKLDPTMCTTIGQFRCTPDDSATQVPTNGALSLSMPAGAIWTVAEIPSSASIAPPSNLSVVVQ